MPVRYPSRNVKEAVGYIGQDFKQGIGVRNIAILVSQKLKYL